YVSYFVCLLLCLYLFVYCFIVIFLLFFFFFFQAEDGIRDSSVTGVQTCALPIYETLLQVPLLAVVPEKWPAGQVMLAGKFATRVALFCTLTSPATCGHDAVVLPVCMQLLCWVLATGAPTVLNSTPADAVLSLDMIVLLMMSTFNASSRETPPPSQPATLLTMMLLVTVAEYHGEREPLIPGNVTLLAPFGKLITSEPLTCCKRRPPPLPLSAALPMIRLASITGPGPTPSLGPTEPRAGTQSWSVGSLQGGSTSE